MRGPRKCPNLLFRLEERIRIGLPDGDSRGDGGAPLLGDLVPVGRRHRAISPWARSVSNRVTRADRRLASAGSVPVSAGNRSARIYLCNCW